MNTLPLLLNTAAHSARGKALRAWLARQPGRFEIIEPSSPEDMTRQAALLAAEGCPVVAVAGGDGTLGRAARGLAGTKSALAVIPSGTMNVFARELGIGSHGFGQALAAIDAGATENIDLFRAGDAVFMQMAGFGPDARAVELVSPGVKRVCGGLAYGISGLRLCIEPADRFTLRWGQDRSCSGKAVLIGNGRFYGGSYPLFGAAKSSDGLMDAIVFHGGLSSILWQIARAWRTGGILPDGDGSYTYVQTAACTLESEKGAPFELDGDFAGRLSAGGHITLSKLPGTLRVCVPPPPPGSLAA